GQYLLVWADGELAESTPASLHASFRLNPTNGSVVLSRNLGGSAQILDYLNYAGVGPGQSVGSFPAGSVGARETFFYPTPGTTNNPAAAPVPLFINEWMAANTGFIADPADGDFDDWFEIYNPGSVAVDLTGYRLTDDLNTRNKFVVPGGIRIPAGGFLLVWADEDVGQTRTNADLHVNFRLSQSGETIALYDPQGRVIDSISFETQTSNVSEGRFPNGNAAPFVTLAPTPRASNLTPNSGPEMGPAELLPGNLIGLIWTAEPGRSYRVQFKGELGAAEWTDLPGTVTATGMTASRTDAVTGAQRFYRVVLVP
ncbi:MAG TPA: lamin tail domain-containing protein, partial [Verrucomicrobiae bacterium]|nr:lamin tail domain-containing protein [Verrucomicrobiae bacterium]